MLRVRSKLMGGRNMMVLWLADAARMTGYPVIEQSGWKTRGHGQMAMCEGVVGHHTATPASAKGDYPSLAVVRDGRQGLAGPLSHLGLGRSGTVYVIAAGNCWHAGASAHAGYKDLNNKYLGIEAEDDGDGKWTDLQKDAYPKLVGALLHVMKRPVSRYISHRGCALPAGRKPDPAGMTDDWMRTMAAKHMATLSGKPSTPTPTPPADASTDLPTLKVGDRNDSEMALQKFMKRRYPSYTPFEPTGFYGAATQKTMAEYQKRKLVTGPDADGSIVGPRTNRELWADGYRGA
jgi:hypothetical protein